MQTPVSVPDKKLTEEKFSELLNQGEQSKEVLLEEYLPQNQEDNWTPRSSDYCVKYNNAPLGRVWGFNIHKLLSGHRIGSVTFVVLTPADEEAKKSARRWQNGDLLGEEGNLEISATNEYGRHFEFIKSKIKWIGYEVVASMEDELSRYTYTFEDVMKLEENEDD